MLHIYITNMKKENEWIGIDSSILFQYWKFNLFLSPISQDINEQNNNTIHSQHCRNKRWLKAEIPQKFLEAGGFNLI